MLNMLHLIFTPAGKKAPFLASLFVAAQYRLVHQANYKSSLTELGEVFTSLYFRRMGADVWDGLLGDMKPLQLTWEEPNGSITRRIKTKVKEFYETVEDGETGSVRKQK